MRITRFVAVLNLVILLAATASAAIIGETGATTVITPPSDVSNDVKESNTQVFAFPEQQNVVLSSGLTVDVSVPGSTPASASNDNFSQATIAAGTPIDSFYLHCDAVGAPSPFLEFTGSITFDTDVLGLILLNDSLNATASFPGLPSTIYSSNGGLEINRTNTFDSVTLSADRRTVSFDFRDSTAPDDVRIITAVPEPATVGLFATGALALLGYCLGKRSAV